jgi:Cu-processing system permease protein
MLRVLSSQLRDALRGRWLLAYGGFFLLVSEVLLRFGGEPERALLSLMNVVLLLVPLASSMFGAMYVYQSGEFMRLMLAQPVARRTLFLGLYLGLAVPMAGAAALGVALPFVGRGMVLGDHGWTLLTLCVASIGLTLSFTALAFAVATAVSDRVKGLATALLIWLFLAVVFDGVILLGVNAFARYPLEKPLLALALLNPVDLSRVVLLMRFDAAALMGYTGAVFKTFFGSTGGLAVASIAMALWVAAPFWIGSQIFRRRDL